jgi:hypothetical protein
MNRRIEVAGLALDSLACLLPVARAKGDAAMPVLGAPPPHQQAVDTLGGLQVTQLPFSPAQFIEGCGQRIRIVKGITRAPASCAPRYRVHVATRDARAPLAQLVGFHDYPKWGARNEAGDYANPIQNGLHPVFLVFRAHPGMWVLRVEDFESGNEVRIPSRVSIWW